MDKTSLQQIDDYYGRLRELGQELGLCVLEPFIRSKYIDKRGYAEEIFYQHSQSIVRNLYMALPALIFGMYDAAGEFGAGVLRVKDTSGTVRDRFYNGSAVESPSGGGYYAPANVSDYGVVIGRGSNAEDFESNTLTTQITHGSAVNQMVYGVTLFSHAFVAAPKYYWSSETRVFDNQSPGSITVTESALYWKTSVGAGGYIYMTFRDLDAWGAGQAVAVGESIEVKYILRVDFP